MECEQTQKDEVEAMQSIFMDEFMMLNESPITYELIVLADREDSEEPEAVRARLRVEYPAAYPQEPPLITPQVESPLTLADLESVKGIIEDACKSQVGQPMVFELTERIRDFLVLRKSQSQIAQEEELKAQDTLKKAETHKLLHATVKVSHEITSFTPVTVETYAKWRAEYDRRVAEEQKIAKSAVDRKIAEAAEDAAKRLTGRQIFEQRRLQLQKKAEKAEDSKAPDGKTEVFYYNEDVFENVGDVDDVDLD